MHTGLYIHIPFCKQKCLYCDFASFAGKTDLIDTYLSALAQEAALVPHTPAQTLYVGGGTPSLLGISQLQQLVQIITAHFGEVSRFEESTFEANPESLSREKADFLRGAGFNRLSLGLQSFNDDELKRIGRVHSAADFLRAYGAARAAGFSNINVDLIAGLPAQSLANFSRSLLHLISLKPEHISVYGLQIEEGTPFFERGIVCDQVLMRTMLEFAHDELARAGYMHYEISNYALAGKESKHNTHYWHNGDYIGLGSAAASYYGGVRRQNVADVQEYISRINAGQSAVAFEEKLTDQAKAGECLMLGLRLLGGMELTAQQESFFAREIEKHIRGGLLMRDGKKVKLTQEGLYLANEVFCSFVAPFDDEI